MYNIDLRHKATPTVHHIVETLYRKLDLGPMFTSGLWNSEGLYFRGLFSIGTTINAFGTKKSVRIIVYVCFSEVLL